MLQRENAVSGTAQNVAHLFDICERMQVRRSRCVPSGHRRVRRRWFHLLPGSVSSWCADPLCSGPRTPVDKGCGNLERFSRARVVGPDFLEDIEDLLGAEHVKGGDGSEVFQSQDKLRYAWSARIPRAAHGHHL